MGTTTGGATAARDPIAHNDRAVEAPTNHNPGRGPGDRGTR